MRRLVGAVVIVAALAAAGYFIFWGTRRPNILFILVDTLRADHMGIYGYERDTTPVADQFARENIKFNFVVTAAPWTPASIASIFTSLYPTAHGMMPPNDRQEAIKKSTRLNESLNTLPEILRDNGYATAGVITNPWLQKAFGFDQGFDTYKYINRVRADLVNKEAVKLLEELKKGSKPFFLYLHYMDAHNPYDPPAEYRNIFPEPLKSREYPPKQVEVMKLYDGDVRHFDFRFGELLDYLKKTGLYDDLTIIFTADHGEQFMERGNQGHGYHVHNEETHVPLIIRTGRKTVPREVNEVASLVDLFPTILDLAGVKWDKPVQGLSLFNTPDLAGRDGVLTEIHRNFNYKSITSPEGKKIILDFGVEQPLVIDPSAQPKSAELYSSREDYREISPLHDENLSKKMLTEFKDVYRQTLANKIKEKVGEIDIDEKTVEELKTLGYLQ